MDQHVKKWTEIKIGRKPKKWMPPCKFELIFGRFCFLHFVYTYFLSIFQSYYFDFQQRKSNSPALHHVFASKLVYRPSTTSNPFPFLPVLGLDSALWERIWKEAGRLPSTPFPLHLQLLLLPLLLCLLLLQIVIGIISYCSCKEYEI